MALFHKNHIIFFALACAICIGSEARADDNKSTTQYKKGQKKKVVKPPSKWVTPPAPKVVQVPQKNSDKIKVTYVYDTLANGEKEYVVGYKNKETNEFRVDSALSYRDPSKKAPPVPKKPEPKETRMVVTEATKKFPASEGIHIKHSSVPTQAMSNYLNDYITNYNRNYGKRLRTLKRTKSKTFSVIENVLKRQGLPLQMKYLAVIESALNPKAVSPVGAVGMWQFMAPTARDMNLVVNEKIDQRTDMYKSTYAATKYMKHLYRIFGDWLLVIASYNSGPGPVLKAIRKTGSKNFWNIKNRLPSETRGHVMAFLATAAIMERLDKFSGLYKYSPQALVLEPSDDEPKLEEELKRQFAQNEKSNLVILVVNKPIAKDIVCKRLQINPQDFERWNPKFDEKLAEKNPKYLMYIPRQKMAVYTYMKIKILQESFKSREEKKNKTTTIAKEIKLAQTDRKNNTTNYIVQYGETIDMVAERFGISVEDLVKLNKIEQFEIYPGDIVRVK